ncbi:hypothetical protein KUCAC02_015484, partial [Chaenocephalus aceratus]
DAARTHTLITHNQTPLEDAVKIDDFGKVVKHAVTGPKFTQKCVAWGREVLWPPLTAPGSVSNESTLQNPSTRPGPKEMYVLTMS